MSDFYKILILWLLVFSQTFAQTVPDIAFNQCVSLHKPVYSSNPALDWSMVSALSDGTDSTILTVQSPVTLALQIDAQTSTADSLILHWRAQSWNNRDVNTASLKHYKIYTSANSTNGVDGDWQFVQEGFSGYKDNFVFFPNNQPKWVKVKELSDDTLRLSRLEIFQSAPVGKKDDIWLLFGDSEMLSCMGVGNTTYSAATRFGEKIHANNPCYYPIVINAGKGGERAVEAVNALGSILDDMPQVSIVAFSYGINDAIFFPLVPYQEHYNNPEMTAFKNAFVGIMDTCINRGILPIPARIPWVHFPNEYSDYVDTSSDKTNGIIPINLNVVDSLIQLYAPYAIDTTTGIPYADFQTWFHEHRDEDEVFQIDFIHFLRKGINEFNKIWVHTAEQIIYTDACDTAGNLTIQCPENIFKHLDDTASAMPFYWDSPLATTTCGLGSSVLLTQVEGTPIGTELGVGNYYIAYEASDNCNNTEMCRFSITIQPPEQVFGCGEVAGFTKVGELNGHGYYLSENVASWKNARDTTTALGGYLATISTQEENDLLYSALNQKTAFLGLYDYLKEGQLEWANGEPVTFDLSIDNTPENNYALLNFWAGTWSMTNEWVQKNYFLEMECAVEDLTLACPENLSIVLPIGQLDTAFWWDAPSAVTFCDTSQDVFLTQVTGSPNGALLSVGSYEYVWNATDSCTNSASCSWVITVDTMAIMGELNIACLGSMEIVLPFGQVDTVVSWDVPDYATTCNVGTDVVLSQISGPPSGSSFEYGTTTITYAVSDNCDNTDTCSFTITVDTTAIMGTLNLECPADLKVEIPIGQTDTILSWDEPEASTTCNIGLGITLAQMQGLPSGSSFGLGISSVEYQAIDNCGNEENCSFLITVSQKPDGIEHVEAGAIELSPNPVKDFLVVDLGTHQKGQVNIFSCQGASIFVRKPLNQKQLKIDVSTLKAGLYFVQFRGVERSSWARFVKE